MSAHPHRQRSLWLCGMLHGFTHVYHVALLPLFLLIQKDLDLASLPHATLLQTIMMIAYFAPSYLAGILADRVDRRTLLCGGLILNALGFICLSLSPNYTLAIVSTIIAGIGGSVYHPAATALIADQFPEKPGRVLGWVGMGASLGFCLSPLYSGWRAMNAGWRAPVMELGLFGLVGAGVFLWFADSTDATRHRDSAREPIFATNRMWLLFFLAAFAFSCRDFTGSSMGTLCSLFLQKSRGWEPFMAGLATCCMFVLAVFSNPLFGSLSDRGRKRWTTLVLVMAAVMVALFPRVPEQWTLLLVAAYGFFFLASFPMVEAVLMESVAPHARSRVMGLFITVGGTAGNFAPWANGERVKSMGAQSQHSATYIPIYNGLAILVLISLAGIFCLHRIGRQRRAMTTGKA